MPDNQQFTPPSSCISGEPLIRLGNGQAPTLDYLLPQKVDFNLYGKFLLNIPLEIFSPAAFETPPLPDLRDKSDEDLKSEILDTINTGGSVGNPYVLPITGPSYHPSLLYNYAFALDGVIRNPYTENLPAEVRGSGEITNQLDYLVKATKERKFALLEASLEGYQPRIELVERPQEANPGIWIVEEYGVASFLGNYGAGKTLKTFSLLPGEQTQISIRSYREETLLSSRSENVLDSLSANSVAEFEKALESENTSSSSSQKNSNAQAQVGFSLFKGIFNAGASGGTSSQSNRSNSVKNISRALSKHSHSSNSHREVNVNTSSEASFKEGEESSTVRQIENINKSRVLNFAFRQLLQEYTTITYLRNIKLIFTNGHPEQTFTYDLEDMDKMLNRFVIVKHREEVRTQILSEITNIKDYQGQSVNFIEQKTEFQFRWVEGTDTKPLERRIIPGNSEELRLEEVAVNYYQRIAELSQSYEGLSVPGIILEVNKNTLRTDSLIVDALLGQGEALDCFNASGQQLSIEKERLENEKMRLILETLSAITDPTERASAMAKLLNPQNT
jgi:hypothetical protein